MTIEQDGRRRTQAGGLQAGKEKKSGKGSKPDLDAKGLEQDFPRSSGRIRGVVKKCTREKKFGQEGEELKLLGVGKRDAATSKKVSEGRYLGSNYANPKGIRAK